MVNGTAFVSGTVTHPDDLRPAIEALGEVGQWWLATRCNGRAVQPADVARAADFENDFNELRAQMEKDSHEQYQTVEHPPQ